MKKLGSFTYFAALSSFTGIQQVPFFLFSDHMKKELTSRGSWYIGPRATEEIIANEKWKDIRGNYRLGIVVLKPAYQRLGLIMNPSVLDEESTSISVTVHNTSSSTVMIRGIFATVFLISKKYISEKATPRSV
ncbi:MAG: hypothetical protein N2V78_09235 [Methanophagales archaeon]|nr:hypothetical protein [Methanophagales archaeon]